MNMEVLSVQNQYPAHFALATDWKSQLTLSTPSNGGLLKSQPSYKFTNTPFKPHHHINHPHNHLHHHQRKQQNLKTSNHTKHTSNSSNKLNCDTTTTTTTTTKSTKNTTITTTTTTTAEAASKTTINGKSLQTQAVQELSLRLLDKLRAAKSRHLACTEVSLPCDLTPRIALEILRLAREEANGLRDCTIYIEFEDEPNNSRRIATLDLNNQRSGNTGYEIYVTLSQDHRGWTALLPQFMKNLSRTITISPEFNITKHRPYSKSMC